MDVILETTSRAILLDLMQVFEVLRLIKNSKKVLVIVRV